MDIEQLMTIKQLTTEIVNLPTDRIGQGLKGVILGIPYSLNQASKLGFTSRPADHLRPDYTVELNEVGAALLGDGNLPPKWLASFFFNDALMRIAACSHRALRILLDTGGEFKKLADRASEKEVDEAEICPLRKVYKDINAFKHGRDELLKKRRIATLTDGIAAAEQLVSLVKKATCS